jgi:hypothetical protein
MYVFCERFRTEQIGGGTSAYPGKPIQYKTLLEAKRAYTEFVVMCDNFGMGTPAPAWIHTGFHGNHVDYVCGVYMYPDWHHCILEANERGTVVQTNSGW